MFCGESSNFCSPFSISQNFEQSGRDIRISDLLRLMLTCVDAMVLTDKMGRIVHCNREWVELTGYTLSEVEGSDCRLLQGSMTDHVETRRSKELQKLQKPSTMTVVNYRKDGSMFLNHVTTLPIRGGYKTNGKYCTYISILGYIDLLMLILCQLIVT